MGIKYRTDLAPRFTQAGVQTSIPNQMARGVGDAGVNFGALIDMLRNGSSVLSIGGVPPDAPSAEAGAQALSERFLGPDVAPQGTLQSLARAGTRGVVGAIPTLPLGGAGVLGSPARIGLEMLSGAGGEIAASAAEGAGGGTLAQLAAGLGGSFSVTGVGKALGIAGGAVAGAVSQTVKDKRTRRMVAEVLGQHIPDRADALRRIQAELDAPLFGRASLTQVLPDPGLQKVERELLKAGGVGNDLRTELFRLRQSNTRAAQALAEQSWAGTAPDRALADYSAKLERWSRKAERAYANKQNLSGIPTQKVKAGAAELLLEAGPVKADYLPNKELSIIGALGETTDLHTLKQLRSRLGNEIRMLARKADANPETERFLNQLVDSVQGTIDEVAEAGGAEAFEAINKLRNADRIWRVGQERFGQKSTQMLNRILGGEFENMAAKFSNFLRSSNPARDLDVAKLTLSGNEEAWGGVQRLMADEVFGEGFETLRGRAGALDEGIDTLLSPSGAAAAFGKLRKNSRAFDVVFGEGAADNATEFLRRANQLGRGISGTPGEMRAAGSSLRDMAEGTVNFVGDVASGNWVAAGMKAYYAATRRSPKSMAEVNKLLAAALVDPSVARPFLESLPAEAVPRWREIANAQIARPAIRVGLGMAGND